MNDTSAANLRSLFAGFLLKAGRYLVGATFLCYLSGFVITNLYLGSLGVVNLDILRARYILSGLLFLSFSGVIIYLIYGLRQTLLKSRNKPPLRIFSDVAWYSLVNISLVCVVVLAVIILAGSPDSPPIGIPRLSPALSWSTWLATAPFITLRVVVVLFEIGMPITFIIVFAWIAFSPTDMQGVRITRRQALTLLVKQYRRLITRFLFLFVFFYIVLIVSNLFTFMSTNQVTDLLSPNQSSLFLPGGWLRFFVAIAAIYAVAIMILIMPLVMRQSHINNDGPSKRLAIFFTIAIVALIVPVYTLGIYPDLPQQMGGGKVLQVTVITSSQELEPSFTDKDIETYLIDRTSTSVLFMLVNKTKQEDLMIEVSSPLIESITYQYNP
jgi:hypothetical protein